MDAIFTSVDLTTMAASVTGLLTAFIVVDLLFVANRQRKKAGIK